MEPADRTEKRPRTCRSLVDDSKLRSCRSAACPHKHDNINWRDWAGLDDGPAGVIAELVLAYDVADYVRLRVVCRPWRQCCTEPRSHSGLVDRRFHPKGWTMLQEELATPSRRCFLNTSTGQCVQVDIPELLNHEVLALTPEGLLVLAHKPPDATTLCMLNPLTRHLIHLPPLSKLLPSEYHDILPDSDSLCLLHSYFEAWGSGISNDNSTVVFCLSRLNTIGMTKPGDDHWTLLDCDGSGMTAPIMFEGRLYCVANNDDLMVLETGTPHLEVAAKINMCVSPMADSLHLVNNLGELMLVHRRFRRCRRFGAENNLERCYDVYRVDLDTKTLFLVMSFSGSAVFMGMRCSLSVSPNVFPSGSISDDTLYLSSDVDKQAEAYHLANGSREGTGCRYDDSSVLQPHTLAASLSLSVTI